MRVVLIILALIAAYLTYAYVNDPAIQYARDARAYHYAARLALDTAHRQALAPVYIELERLAVHAIMILIVLLIALFVYFVIDTLNNRR